MGGLGVRGGAGRSHPTCLGSSYLLCPILPSVPWLLPQLPALASGPPPYLRDTFRSSLYRGFLQCKGVQGVSNQPRWQQLEARPILPLSSVRPACCQQSELSGVRQTPHSARLRQSQELHPGFRSCPFSPTVPQLP